MKNSLSIVWEVTKWEFNRYFKFMDMVKGILFLGFFMVVGGLVGSWVGSETVKNPEIAIANYGVFEPESFESDALNFSDQRETPVDSLKAHLEAGRFDAILTINSLDEAHIILPSERAWTTTLNALLNDLRADHKIAELDISPEIYADLSASIEITSEYIRAAKSTYVDKVVAGGSIVLVLLAVFMGLAYQFAAITGEKNQRITEQIMSAIPSQTWIDGKILGITGIGFAYVLFYGVMGIIGMLALAYFGVPFDGILGLINPLFLLIFFSLSILGVLMWNSFLAGVAATIDDPNTSQKSGLIMIPMLPVFLSFFALANPDTLPIKILGLFPLTSYAVLPARMVLTQIQWWEPIVALALLAGTAWLFRLLAGRIFTAGMLMYGKEPTMKEMWYWMKKSS